MPDLATMRLGCRWSPARVHVPEPVGVSSPVSSAWSRIVGTPRLSGDNTVLGDCVPTACANAVQDAMAGAGDYGPIHQSVIVDTYSAVTGYTPGDPASDQGTDPSSMWGWWQQHDIAGYRLRKATPIDPQSEYAVRKTIETSGGVILIVALSIEQQTQVEWLPVGTPGSWGYHCVWVDEYTGRLSFATSWGRVTPIHQDYLASPGFTVGAFALDLVAA
ncbi:MAG: hypothetical protein PHZ23_15910 [Acidiphilium sp.]|nr:hypothetical protein [Acidiphilium sp.]